MAKIDVDRQKLAGFCRRHHILRLALFGSVLRSDFGPESDIDAAEADKAVVAALAAKGNPAILELIRQRGS